MHLLRGYDDDSASDLRRTGVAPGTGCTSRTGMPRLTNGPCSYVEVPKDAVNDADRNRLLVLGWTAIDGRWGFLETPGPARTLNLR